MTPQEALVKLLKNHHLAKEASAVYFSTANANWAPDRQRVVSPLSVAIDFIAAAQDQS